MIPPGQPVNYKTCVVNAHSHLDKLDTYDTTIVRTTDQSQCKITPLAYISTPNSHIIDNCLIGN